MNLHNLVISTAARHPGRTAVSGPAGELSYAELDRRAGELARTLAARGVVRGDRVLIWGPKSPGMVAAMQAVLRLGAAYVPAGESTPAARVALMAADCAARVICTTAGLMDRIGAGIDRVDVDAPGAGSIVPAESGAGDLAYILYTSGSTGTPKGVCVSHGNARAFVDWAVAELGARAEDRFANHAPFTFDLSVLDLYAAFSVGAAVCLIPGGLAYAPGRLVELLHEQRISVWYSVPSALTLMIRDGGLLDAPAPAGLRAVLFAGEPFPIPHVRGLARWTTARLLNLYGPTETNVCTFHEVRPEDLARDRPVPIGLASCGDKVWPVRPDGTVAGPGEEGELMVEGPTVMLGYWGHEPHRGPYATGDIVRALPDGTLEYVGRTDHLVKVRGHRVEPGEVEAVLVAHPGVAEAAVTVEGSGLDARLVAHVRARAGAEPGVLALKRHSAGRLPPYMICDEFRFVAELPRTGNGKIDRLALERRTT
ncbi:amino acid adenylation domain-containing protein [Nonomuraea sp. 10N515B]|uniref:amino acid adenylation domain-containing protein n=1 Tax=Nonomuraea sp. 10N515B TaxID=3457422 RepID=UPI003FCD4A61